MVLGYRMGNEITNNHTGPMFNSNSLHSDDIPQHGFNPTCSSCRPTFIGTYVKCKWVQILFEPHMGIQCFDDLTMFDEVWSNAMWIIDCLGLVLT